jgi:hypothetical protein
MNKIVFIVICATLLFSSCGGNKASKEAEEVNNSEAVTKATQEILYCQSCGMPLTEEEFIANDDDSANQEYCKYCYADGNFTMPDITMEEMIDLCVPYMVENGMPEDDARKMMQETLPNLKRWKK